MVDLSTTMATQTKPMTDYEKMRIVELRNKYGLTEKQARYVDVSLENPGTPQRTKGIMAGYSPTGVQRNGYEQLNATKVRGALSEEAEKRLAVSLKEYDRNPRRWVLENLAKHAKGETSADESVQVRATELIGKMTGEFKDGVVVDIGEDTIRKMSRSVLTGIDRALPEGTE